MDIGRKKVLKGELEKYEGEKGKGIGGMISKGLKEGNVKGILEKKDAEKIYCCLNL